MIFGKIIIAGAVISSLVACGEKIVTKNEPVKKVDTLNQKVVPETLKEHLKTIESMANNADYPAMKLMYDRLQEIIKIEPENKKAQLYLKLLKPVVRMKGVHRKMDHLVALKEGHKGFSDHIRNFERRPYNDRYTYISKHTAADWNYLRAVKAENIFRSEKDVQEFTDSLLSDFQEIYRFAKQNEMQSLNLKVYKADDCDYRSHSQWSPLNPDGTDNSFFVNNPEGEFLQGWELNEINRKINNLKSELKGSLEQHETVVTEMQELEDRKAEILDSIPSIIYGYGTCNSSLTDYKFTTLDWKKLQAAATGVSLLIASHNAYDATGLISFSNITKLFSNEIKKQIPAKTVKDIVASDKRTFESLGKLRKNNQLALFQQTTSSLINGIQWVWENQDMIPCENKLNITSLGLEGNGICGASSSSESQLNSSEHLSLFGKAIPSQDKVTKTSGEMLDAFVEATSQARDTDISVDGEVYTVRSDARMIFYAPVKDLKDYIGEEFDVLGNAVRVQDSTFSGLFPEGNLNDLLRVKSSNDLNSPNRQQREFPVIQSVPQPEDQAFTESVNTTTDQFLDTFHMQGYDHTER